MTRTLEIDFLPLTAARERTVTVITGPELAMGPTARKIDQAADGVVTRCAQAAGFKGKARQSIEILAPAGLDTARLLVVGAGDGKGRELDQILLGGAIAGAIQQRPTTTASVVVELPELSTRAAAELAADIAAGAMLRCYKFDKYLTKKPAEDNGNSGGDRNGLARLHLHVADPDAARHAFKRKEAVARGVMLARDLVNEPANVLGPVEFADRAGELAGLGVEIETLDVPAMEKLGMRALLGVGQGSVRPSRVVVMQWNGAKSKRAKPVCIVGKGVVFDTGGISIKPAAGMEDMKGDMGGAACVVGLMHALAARQAPVNVVGLIGLTENMPSGTAQRPGDIVTSMAGLTIEVLNTDAEGRLVLADVLHYAQDRFKPKLIVDLATLTGAIMVALGKEYAGLFANDDKLAEDLFAAGEATGERVWRMPLDKAYDKLIDSRNADMKNIGGRFAGAITGAQFIQRFIKDTPWAHLDVAGVAMDSGKTDISHSWASGWGVRLLDRMIADKHEKAEK